MNKTVPVPQIRVAITHGDRYSAAGIGALLQSDSGFAILDAAMQVPAVDVVVTDYVTGVKQATVMRSRRNQTPLTLIVTDQNTGWQVRCAVDAGARGYLLQDCSVDELCEAVRSVAQGRRYLSGAVTERLMDSLTYAIPTARELQVLQLLAQGLSNKHIGRSLGIGEGTVKIHVKALMDKLGESTRTGAMVEAVRRGFLARMSKATAFSVAQA